MVDQDESERSTSRDLCLTDKYKKKLHSREFIRICRSCGQDKLDVEYLYNMYRIVHLTQICVMNLPAHLNP